MTAIGAPSLRGRGLERLGGSRYARCRSGRRSPRRGRSPAGVVVRRRRREVAGAEASATTSGARSTTSCSVEAARSPAVKSSSPGRGRADDGAGVVSIATCRRRDQEGEVGRTVAGAELRPSGTGGRRRASARRRQSMRRWGSRCLRRDPWVPTPRRRWRRPPADRDRTCAPHQRRCRRGPGGRRSSPCRGRRRGDECDDDKVGHDSLLREIQTGDADLVRAHLLGVGDGRAGKSGGRAAVGDGEGESVVGVASGDVPVEVAEQAGVARTHGAHDGGRRGRRVPGTVNG